MMQNTIVSFWICWYSLYNTTVYLYSMKMNSISKKLNKLTSLFISNILSIRLQTADTKSGDQGYVIMNRQDERAKGKRILVGGYLTLGEPKEMTIGGCSCVLKRYQSDHEDEYSLK